jgi:flavin reductase (DIM6/NTAB) family NADH-FMN oxidoreductase RutF
MTDSLPEQFKSAMRRLAASVAVVVVRGDDGPVGMAATSVTSLTVDPPALLVCVNRATSIHASLNPGAPISVNLLSDHQSEVSAAFGGGMAHEQRFAVGVWNMGPQGLPELAEAQANLACVVDTILAYATHSIVIARVVDVRISGEVAPLIYQDGTYL